MKYSQLIPFDNQNSEDDCLGKKGGSGEKKKGDNSVALELEKSIP